MQRRYKIPTYYGLPIGINIPEIIDNTIKSKMFTSASLNLLIKIDKLGINVKIAYTIKPYGVSS